MILPESEYKVLEVQTELSIDICFTNFTLYPGDYFIYYIKSPRNIIIYYKIRKSLIGETISNKYNEFIVKKSNNLIRIGNKLSWIDTNNCIGKELIDITKRYNRDKLLKQLILPNINN